MGISYEICVCFSEIYSFIMGLTNIENVNANPPTPTNPRLTTYIN